jgi:hypothetical protein
VPVPEQVPALDRVLVLDSALVRAVKKEVVPDLAPAQVQDLGRASLVEGQAYPPQLEAQRKAAAFIVARALIWPVLEIPLHSLATCPRRAPVERGSVVARPRVADFPAAPEVPQAPPAQELPLAASAAA